MFCFLFYHFSTIECFLYLLLREEFLLWFRWIASCLWFFFLFLRRTLYNTWSHYGRLQVLIMIFNKKADVNIYSISNSKNRPWSLLSFVSRIVVHEVLRPSVCRTVLILLWFQVIGKIIKTLDFHNNNYLLDLSSLDVSSRGVFRTLSNI